MDFRAGVAGWDYPDWAGPVYPSSRASFDRLHYLSRFIDLVEINATFYRPNTTQHAEQWLRRIESNPRFLFTAKVHRSWTHTDDSPGDDDLEGLRPLREAGRLGALLLQFPASFHATPRSMERLHRLADCAAGWPLVVEVRDAGWGRAEIWEPFAARRLSRCIVDQPQASPNTLPATADAAAPLPYLRLHGRRAALWFDPRATRDSRYDYQYRMETLKPLLALLEPENPRTGFIVMNNHPRGQALVNAMQIRHLLGEAELEAPASLVESYPDALPFCRPVREGLF
jgi:uncharacterized protein YecE (DUF72 family)